MNNNARRLHVRIARKSERNDAQYARAANERAGRDAPLGLRGRLKLVERAKSIIDISGLATSWQVLQALVKIEENGVEARQL